MDLQVVRSLDRDGRARIARELTVKPTTDCWLANEVGGESGVDPGGHPVLREAPGVGGERKQAEGPGPGLRWASTCAGRLSGYFRMVSNEMLPRTSLTPEALVGAIVGAVDADFLSAQLWPLDLALAALADAAPENGAVQRAIERMPQATIRNGLRFTGLRPTIHALVRRQLLRPGGEGWAAGYAVSPALRREGQTLAGSFTPSERRALRKAGQALLAATSMASKNPAASLPSGSATI